MTCCGSRTLGLIRTGEAGLDWQLQWLSWTSLYPRGVEGPEVHPNKSWINAAPVEQSDTWIKVYLFSIWLDPVLIWSLQLCQKQHICQFWEVLFQSFSGHIWLLSAGRIQNRTALTHSNHQWSNHIQPVILIQRKDVCHTWSLFQWNNNFAFRKSNYCWL